MCKDKIEIPIMFCFDNNYVVPASVAILSLLEKVNKNYIYSLFILHTDITAENQDKLQKTIEPFLEFSKLKFINLENRFEDIWKKIHTKGHFSKEVMYKVLASSIFPQYEKILVSDVDVVFMNDISDSYFDLDINEDYYLAGTKIIGKMMWYMDIYNKLFSEEEIKKLSSFCGGYLVLNLKKLREDNMEEKFIECFQKEGYRINQMEQDILNLVCYPKIKKLKLKYVACSYMWDIYRTDEDKETDQNYSKEEIDDAMNNTVQLHYATSVKPWKNVECTKSEEWFKYIVKTPFLTEYLKKLPFKIELPKKVIDSIVDSQISSGNFNKCFGEPLNRVEYILIRLLRYAIKNPLFIAKPSFYKKVIKKIKNRISMYNNISLLIIDDVFPSQLSPFRYEEYITYLNKFNNVFVMSTGNSLPALKEYRGIDYVIEKFEEEYPKFKNKIINYKINDKESTDKINLFLNSHSNKVAVITFIQNVINSEFNNLEFLEKNKIPFIFTLYPGGGFLLDDIQCDEKLRKIFSSQYFKKVIVTQKLTYDYLLKKNLCTKEKIKFIYGIVTPEKMLKNKIDNKKYFGFDKEKLDICFVAHKYSENGIDKGYDLFIAAAKKLVVKYPNIQFHVVGGFNEKDIDISDIKDKIKFYGIRESNSFISFYEDKDIIISPNRPFILNPGSFDGFPTGCCSDAMLNRVALFCTDELGLNSKFKDKKDLVIIKPNVDNIVSNVEYYYKNPRKLRNISYNGRNLVKINYSFSQQMFPRIKLLKKIYKELKK